jgi:hypothetical protein
MSGNNINIITGIKTRKNDITDSQIKLNWWVKAKKKKLKKAERQSMFSVHFYAKAERQACLVSIFVASIY